MNLLDNVDIHTLQGKALRNNESFENKRDGDHSVRIDSWGLFDFNSPTSKAFFSIQGHLLTKQLTGIFFTNDSMKFAQNLPSATRVLTTAIA